MYFKTRFEFTVFKKWSVAFFQCRDFDKDNELPWHATSHPNFNVKNWSIAKPSDLLFREMENVF